MNFEKQYFENTNYNQKYKIPEFKKKFENRNYDQKYKFSEF